MSSMASVLEINFLVVELDYCNMLDTVEAAKLQNSKHCLKKTTTTRYEDVTNHAGNIYEAMLSTPTECLPV